MKSAGILSARLRTCLLSVAALSAFCPAGMAAKVTTQPRMAMEVAGEFLAAGAAMVRGGDADGVAAQFAVDGELVLKTLKSGSRPVVEIIRGTESLREWFKVVENLADTKVNNVVENARYLAEDLIYVVGTMELTARDGSVTMLPFSQVRRLEGDAWKILSHQIVFN